MDITKEEAGLLYNLIQNCSFKGDSLEVALSLKGKVISFLSPEKLTEEEVQIEEAVLEKKSE